MHLERSGGAAFLCFALYFFHVVSEERRFDWKGGRMGGAGFRLVWGGFTYVHLSIDIAMQTNTIHIKGAYHRFD